MTKPKNPILALLLALLWALALVPYTVVRLLVLSPFVLLWAVYYIAYDEAPGWLDRLMERRL